MSKTLFWFTQDLRLHDNPALLHAINNSASLTCVFVIEPRWLKPGHFGVQSLGVSRQRFLRQSLQHLMEQLAHFGHNLQILFGTPEQSLTQWLDDYGYDRLVTTRQAGAYEHRCHVHLTSVCDERGVRFECYDGFSLFDHAQLPSFEAFPSTFSQFKKAVIDLSPMPPLARPLFLPAAVPVSPKNEINRLVPLKQQGSTQAYVNGGEQHALAHIDAYFASEAPSTYKKTRNRLDDWSSSSKFSPWLANGCLSVRQAYYALSEYEAKHEANDSTQWLYYELLWREYFYWLAHEQRHHLFTFGGAKNKKLLTSFYPQRFKQWCEGETPWPLVNSCMRQLNATGYMSNRGRQIVASCLVNELALDWRCGAAYFEQQLVDYDVASNWGNWQYIAGVGADPRGGRRFNIDKQTKEHDPNGEYIARWSNPDDSTCRRQIDSVDAADWPIAPRH